MAETGSAIIETAHCIMGLPRLHFQQVRRTKDTAQCHLKLSWKKNQESTQFIIVLSCLQKPAHGLALTTPKYCTGKKFAVISYTSEAPTPR
jgi:hypothetical protein